MANPFAEDGNQREYPWVVYVELQDREKTLYGGTLITLKNVLTVASIFDGNRQENLQNKVKVVSDHDGNLGRFLKFQENDLD